MIFGSVGTELLISNISNHRPSTTLVLIGTTLVIGIIFLLVDKTIRIIEKIHDTYEDKKNRSIEFGLVPILSLSICFVAVSTFSYFDFYRFTDREIITACQFILIYSVMGYLALILSALITTPIVATLRVAGTKAETIKSVSEWSFALTGIIGFIAWVSICLRVGGCLEYQYTSDPMRAWRLDLGFWGVLVTIIFVFIPILLEIGMQEDADLLAED